MDINLNRWLRYSIPVFELTFASMLKGGPMVQLLLLCMMLFQAGTQRAANPIIDNERVTVQDVSDYSTSPQPTDAVVVSLAGNAVYVPKGAASKITGRLFVIDLKDHP